MAGNESLSKSSTIFMKQTLRREGGFLGDTLRTPSGNDRRWKFLQTFLISSRCLEAFLDASG